MEQARSTFARLLADASPADLRRGSRGTRWTNEQLLFHMLFGYLIVRALLPLVKLMGRLPDPIIVRFAWLLDGAAAPFHAINYGGSCAGAVVFGHRRMGRRMDRVIMSLQRHLDRESDGSLALRMRFPARWDPFFTESMTVADVYHYGTEHFEFHRQQLTLDQAG
jgi:DinB superfamily